MTTAQDPEKNAAKAAQLIKAAMEEMNTPAYRERLYFLARDYHNRYVSFVAAGFTEAQALALVIGKP
jgi:hypothetical protein